MARKTTPQHKSCKFQYQHKDFEKNNGTTEVVPNEALSVREILFRNTQGLDYDNYKTPFYEEQASFSSTDLHKIQDMELPDKMLYLDSVTEQANDLRAKIQDYSDKQAQAQKQAEKTIAIAQQNEASESEGSK